MRRAALLVLVVAACTAAPRPACEADGPLATICGFENPEDVAYSREHEAVVISEMRRGDAGGALSTLRPGSRTPRRLWPQTRLPGIEAGPAAGDPSCAPPDVAVFAPHGLFLAPAGLYVVNHGGRESVEIFRLDGVGEELEARWIGCVELPTGTSGNDVAVGPRGEVVVSNPSAPGGLLRASLASVLGLHTGDVLLWKAGSGWRRIPGSESSVPNGVAISADGQQVYYAEAGAGQVVRLGPDGSERTVVQVPGRPDNLSWSDSRTLRVASHESFLALAACWRGGPCRAPWAVYEIDAETLAVDRRLAHEGEKIGAVASAVSVGNRFYLGSAFGDRIGVWSAEEGGS